jgi:hypothetical protein
MVQDARYTAGLAITIPSGETLNTILPSAAVRASLLLGFDASGNVAVSAPVAGPTGPAGPSYPYAAAGGTVDALTATFSPAITFVAGTTVALKLAGANATTTPTLNGNGTGVKTITKRGGAALAVGDLPGINSVAILSPDTVNGHWELLNPAGPSTTASLGTNAFTGGQSGVLTTLAYNATTTVDFNAGNNFATLLTGNTTVGVPSNPKAGQQFELGIVQDTTGSRTVAYAWPFSFTGATVPTASTAGGTRDDLYGSCKFYLQNTVTITLASPGVATLNAHNMFTGQKLQLTTTGALPTGLAINTTYYAIVLTANTFNFASSFANAIAGTGINTSVSQSGVHTLTAMTISANLNKNVG